MNYNCGDHLKRLGTSHLGSYSHHGGFWHHGIYIGHGKVIHYADIGIITVVSFETFAEGKPTKKVHHFGFMSKSPDEIVKRAESLLGEDKYNLIFNNCESFANWCVTGKKVSFQSLRYLGVCFGVVLFVGKVIFGHRKNT